MPITRVTMFKLDEEHIDEVFAQYDILNSNSQKDGKPYILSMKAKKIIPDPRNQGFTLAANSTFASLEDMKYYDEGDPAHQELRKVVGKFAKGVMTVYWESE